MAKKAIIWRRGSTKKQEIESQDFELTALAIDEGFEEENLIHIGEAGASAIKQNDLYLMEVEKLISTLENDKTVKTVFCWEVSRLARVELAFYKMKDYFINNHIQLICKTPSLKLYDEDGKINQGAEITLSLLVTLARQEMELKFERFKRAKERNKLEGKFNGGKLKLGYTLDNTNHFIINEEKSQIIRNVFDWYIHGMSLKKIYNKLVEIGVYSSLKNFNTGGKRIGYLLKDKSYIGENSYPQIISNEVFNQAQERLSNRKKWHDSKNVYFCKGLIKDTLTNSTLVARFGTLVYCLRHKEHCISLNLNAMDYLAEYSSNVLLAHYNAKKAQSNKAEYKLKIKENENIITIKQSQIKEHEKVIQRAIQMNITQPKYFGTEKMNTVIKQNESVINKLNSEISDLQTENTRMNNWLNGSQQFINTIKGVSDEKKKEMIDSVIDRILVTELEKHSFKIEVKNKIGVICDSYFIYSSQGHKIHLKQIFSDGRTFDLTPQINANKRFERKRYEK